MMRSFVLVSVLLLGGCAGLLDKLKTETPILTEDLAIDVCQGYPEAYALLQDNAKTSPTAANWLATGAEAVAALNAGCPAFLANPSSPAAQSVAFQEAATAFVEMELAAVIQSFTTAPVTKVGG